ncbi:BQ2448_165 [Microbotryum intermedium]|uniref:BQ2448_165 protein n=1 Tax=Microbotryum intermedium TaxID=269621 RepID=A0A238F846_9BASI|nr:BQ2448_165 [Microbotryum intermedium]
MSTNVEDKSTSTNASATAPATATSTSAADETPNVAALSLEDDGNNDASSPKNADEGLTLRALVSSKEAATQSVGRLRTLAQPACIHPRLTAMHLRCNGHRHYHRIRSLSLCSVIIGRGGATIATIRQDSNVKAGVSKVVPGIVDRVLSVGGSVDGVGKAYSLVAQTILENPVPAPGAADAPTTPTSTTTTVRLLISHLLIGSVIGKGGAKIRQIQDVSGARMVASKEMLPQSTERVVEVSGVPEAIRLAVSEIAKCLIEDWDRSQGTVLYHPGSEGIGHGGAIGNGFPAGASLFAVGGNRRVSSGNHTGGYGGGNQRRASSGIEGGVLGNAAPSPQARRTSGNGAGGAAPSAPAANESDPNFREQKISIPSDMVGCIIGRSGTKINEIRRLSGSKISIAKTAHDDTGERMFVISGLPEHNEKALFLLYNQLENEKNRRLSAQEEGEGAQEA